jgi:hypothetical protein
VVGYEMMVGSATNVMFQNKKEIHMDEPGTTFLVLDLPPTRISFVIRMTG